MRDSASSRRLSLDGELASKKKAGARIGMAWIIDGENGILWHNGGTGNYNCYLGVSKEKNMAVVVLSNLRPSYRIPATVLGVKLLTQDEH